MIPHERIIDSHQENRCTARRLQPHRETVGIQCLIQWSHHMGHMEHQENSWTARESQMFGSMNPIKFISSLHLHQHHTEEIPFPKGPEVRSLNIQ